MTDLIIFKRKDICEISADKNVVVLLGGIPIRRFDKTEWVLARKHSAINPADLRPKGRWIKRNGRHDCSECSAVGMPYWKACPGCGAEMREETHDEAGE